MKTSMSTRNFVFVAFATNTKFLVDIEVFNEFTHGVFVAMLVLRWMIGGARILLVVL